MVCQWGAIWRLKTYLINKYLVVTTPKALKNDVSVCRQIYLDKKTLVMVKSNQISFIPRFLLNIDTLLQENIFMMDIAGTFFSNLSNYVQEFLVYKVLKVTKISLTKTNQQWNQRLLLVSNALVEAEKISKQSQHKFNQKSVSAILWHSW